MHFMVKNIAYRYPNSYKGNVFLSLSLLLKTNCVTFDYMLLQKINV